jgi:RHS repeat-associated protein
VEYSPEQRVATLAESDADTTRFAYTLTRGLGDTSTTVTDALSHPTVYTINHYGAATVVTDMDGRATLTDWDPVHLQPRQVTDAEGTTTTYVYDDNGNKTKETIQHVAGMRERKWSYRPATEFSPPYIKDRVGTATDANGNLTNYTYDAHGHALSMERGGVTQHDTYDPDGDHASHTDGRGKVWLYRYDTYGNVRETEDPLHNLIRATFDDRGRMTSTTDALGATTATEYDALDRAVKVTFPATLAGVASTTTEYLDSLDMRVESLPRGGRTVTALDKQGRVLSVRSPNLRTRHRTYDFVGNVTREEDFEGNATTFVYDHINRVTTKREPQGRTTLYTYDNVGHVLTETVGQGDDALIDPRTTTYAYNDPLYGRTLVRRHLDTPSHDVDETTEYDNVGNVKKVTDGLQHPVERSYDARDRLHIQTELLGKVTTIEYDGTDHKISETLANPAGSGDQVRQWAYDDAGRLIDTIDATGGHRRQTYDAVGNVLTRSDALGHLGKMSYDARRHVVTETGAEDAQLTTYGYDLDGNRTEETWANGRHLVHTFDDADQRKQSDDGLGRVEAMEYDGNGRVTAHTDANGHVTTTRYDGLGRVFQQDLPTTDVTRVLKRTYDVHGEVLTEIDPGGHTTRYGYDALARNVSVTLPDVAGDSGVPRITDYDDAGNVKRQGDGRGFVTHFDVDDLNRRVGQTDPADGEGRALQQAWAFDQAGNAISHTDRSGILTLTSFDKENRATGVMRDGLLISQTGYDAQGNVHEQRDALQRLTQFRYDRANRKVREDRSLGGAPCNSAGCAVTEGSSLRWTYTPLNDVASESDADGLTTAHTYTPRRYAESDTLAGETTRYTVDGMGHRKTTQRPKFGASTLWIYSYDEADHLKTVTDPLGATDAAHHTTTYGYDADGNRTTVTDANGHLTTFAYDDRHRFTGKTYPSTSAGTATHTSTYDPDGNVIGEVTPNGAVITNTVDALNRRTEQTIANAQPGEVAATHWGYDGNGNLLTIQETLQGQAPRTETRRYDRFDRLEHAQNVYGKTVDYTYDAVGNRTTLRDSDGNQTTWAYDGLNRNTAVSVPGQGTTNQGYFPSGKLQAVTRPDGSTSQNSYDAAGRIASITHTKAGSDVAKVSYLYDLNGNRREQHETNGAVTGNGEEITTYHYDEADRLDQLIEPNRTTLYQLDPVGNRIDEAVTVGGTQVSHSTLHYNERDQLTQRDDALANVHVTQTYDADGNSKTEVVNGATRTYTYDARDRLTALALPSATPMSFDYDSNGLRLRKTQGASETRYQYDQASLLAETNAIGNPLTRYHYSATQLISRTEQGSAPTQRHYLLDALHTPMVLLTQEGAISTRTSYDAWGEVRKQQGTDGNTLTPNRDGALAELPTNDQQPIGFTGYLKDSESGLYYAKARYYDPAIARFTNEDPEAGKDLQPPSLHRYLYAYANPAVYYDPTGRAGFLTDWRDGFNLNEQIMRKSVTDLPKAAGLLVASQVGVMRGFNALASAPVRALNLASDVIAQALPGQFFEGVSDQSSVELGRSVDTVVPLMKEYSDNPDLAKLRWGIAGGEKLRAYQIAMYQLDPGTISDNTSFATQVVVPFGMEKALPELLNTVIFESAPKVPVAPKNLSGLRSESKGLPADGEKPLASFFDKPNAGHPYARKDLPGGTGRALAAHGQLDSRKPMTIVPQGTAVSLWTQEGVALPDAVGRMIEAGKYEEIGRLKEIDSGIGEKLDGAMSYLPGGEIPDYTISPPEGLTIMRNSITVNKPTRLSNLLKENMGCIDYAACTVVRGMPER